MVRRDLYSVTRRFDLAMMLTGTTGFAVLFAGMRALGTPDFVFAFFAGLIATVAAAQALLFGGNDPRRASIYSGWVYCVVMPGVLEVLSGVVGLAGQRSGGPVLLVGCISLSAMLLGGVVGYVAGALAAGVFLIAELVREALPSLLSPFSSSAPRGPQSPWDDEEI